MERIYQMRVVPDLLSSMHPSIHVRITANTLGMVSGKANQIVEPGSFLLPRQVRALMPVVLISYFFSLIDFCPAEDLRECLPYRYTALYTHPSGCR